LSDGYVSVETLCLGSWYALEQCGRLLQSAAFVFDSGDCATAVALAMFGREELGRSRMLRELARRVAAGEQIRADAVQAECEDHVIKQRAAVLGITLISEPPSPINRLIREMMMLTPGTEEYRRADDKLHEALEAKRRRLPQDRHNMREAALYVDLDDAGTHWLRPSMLDGAHCYEEICGAVNDYAGRYDRFENGDLERDFPEMAAARKGMHSKVALPVPRWPNPPANTPTPKE